MQAEVKAAARSIIHCCRAYQPGRHGFRGPLLKAMLAAAAVIMIQSPTASLAGWGAIACGSDGSGGCSSSWGWASRSEAETYAMTLCSRKRYGCAIARWEHNSCTYGPHGSWACN